LSGPKEVYFSLLVHLSLPAVAEREPCLSHFGPIVAPSAESMVRMWIRGAVQARFAFPAIWLKEEFVAALIFGSPEIQVLYNPSATGTRRGWLPTAGTYRRRGQVVYIPELNQSHFLDSVAIRSRQQRDFDSTICCVIGAGDGCRYDHPKVDVAGTSPGL
jgi:hypothetical protein